MTKHELARCGLVGRFNAKWDIVESGCWEWNASRHRAGRKGYGKISVDGKMKFAHRVSYELNVGDIPDGMVIDHICNNKGCVNPDHLRVTTQRHNATRGEGFAAVNSRKTKCRRGHQYTEENTKIYHRNGCRSRICLKCVKIDNASRRER